MNVMSSLEALRGLYSKPTSLFSLAYLKTLLASCRVVVVACSRQLAAREQFGCSAVAKLQVEHVVQFFHH